MNWQGFVGPTLLIAIVTGVFSIGALYQRVESLEKNGVTQNDLANRISRIEGVVLSMDKQLDRIEKHLDGRR